MPINISLVGLFSQLFQGLFWKYLIMTVNHFKDKIMLHKIKLFRWAIVQIYVNVEIRSKNIFLSISQDNYTKWLYVFICLENSFTMTCRNEKLSIFEKLLKLYMVLYISIFYHDCFLDLFHRPSQHMLSLWIL